MKDPRNITPAEFELLEILWQFSRPASVTEVRTQLQRTRQSAYTTVMTLLDKMARKGSLKRTKKGKAYLYLPVVSRDDVLQFALAGFLTSYFGGELNRLEAFLRRHHQRSDTSELARSKEAPASPEEIDIVLL